MKSSTLREKLEEIERIYGDLDVIYDNDIFPVRSVGVRVLGTKKVLLDYTDENY